MKTVDGEGIDKKERLGTEEGGVVRGGVMSNPEGTVCTKVSICSQLV